MPPHKTRTRDDASQGIYEGGYAGPRHAPNALRGLRRSFDIYYRDHDRTARMDRLNAALVAPGSVVFDIGAHVGDRTGSFLRLGATVVALEPQPLVFRALRRIYGRCPRATLLPMAAGARKGELDFFLNPGNPTVATAAREFISAASGAAGWEGQTWDGLTQVRVTTLDTLIEQHGVPDFVKIDVEGYEAEVLKGVSIALPLLSFEVTTIQRAAGDECIDRLSMLGAYRFNMSVGEDHVMQFRNWVGVGEMRQRIIDLPHDTNAFDVYARRV
ncbi:MAG: FkbM family methyltransferase [Pseudomonadota bacterium]